MTRQDLRSHTELDPARSDSEISMKETSGGIPGTPLPNRSEVSQSIRPCFDCDDGPSSGPFLMKLPSQTSQKVLPFSTSPYGDELGSRKRHSGNQSCVVM